MLKNWKNVYIGCTLIIQRITENIFITVGTILIKINGFSLDLNLRRSAQRKRSSDILIGRNWSSYTRLPPRPPPTPPSPIVTAFKPQPWNINICLTAFVYWQHVYPIKGETSYLKTVMVTTTKHNNLESYGANVSTTCS